MTVTQQRKGRLHIDYIKEIAIAYWAKMNWKDGMYPTCLRDAMKEHREYLIRCLEEQKKISLEKTPRCNDCMTPLDQNDFFHYGYYCLDCFSCRMNGESHEKIRTSISPRLPKLWLNL